MQGSHFSCDTKFHVFSRLFSGKSNETQGQFGFEVNQNYFCKWHLEKWSLKHKICKCQGFSRFWVKIPCFYDFWANSRHFPDLENKMTKFQVFKIFQVGWEPCSWGLNAHLVWNFHRYEYNSRVSVMSKFHLIKQICQYIIYTYV